MAYLQPYLSSSATGRVDLYGAEISQMHKNFIRTPELPSKFTSSDFVGEVDFIGCENDAISIQGVFDATKTNLLSNLKTLSKTTSSVYIYDPIFFSSGTQKIVIESLKMQRKADDGVSAVSSDIVKGSLVYYQMEAWLTE